MADTQAPLFTITSEHLESGLRGYPVGYCTTSFVDPKLGLHYRGIPVEKVSAKSPEEVMYLLFNGALPSKDELAQFCHELEKRSFVDDDFFDRLKGFPTTSHPLKLLATAILLAGVLYGTGDWKEDFLQLAAKIPTISGGVIRYLKSKKPFQSKDVVKAALSGTTWTEKLLNAIGEEIIHPSKRESAYEALSLFMVLHMDHGGGNLSTFVGKAVASGLEDMYGSIAGAMLALAGPRHGRANQDSLDYLNKLLNKYGADISAEQLEKALRESLAQGDLIYGYGHAVLRVEDARATVLYDIAQKKYKEHPLVKMALLLRQVAPSILSENPKISDPYPNVDAISGPLLIASGFQEADCMPVLFGCSRVLGIARQIVYERVEARDGKGLPIVRPKYLYLNDQSEKTHQAG